MQDVWMNVLVRVQLKEGVDSVVWDEVKNVTHSLARVFTPESRQKNDVSNCNKLKSLCRKYGNVQDEKCLAMVNDLQSLIVGLLYGDPVSSDMKIAYFQGANDPRDIIKTPQNEKALSAIGALKPGDWVFIPSEDPGYQLQQLLVCVEETGHFILLIKAG